MDPFLWLVMITTAMAGASTALLGVFIVGMRVPFIGTCVSHAAMAGSIWAVILGINPTAGAMAASTALSISLAGVRPDRSNLDTNVGLGVLFSLALGLAFLGLGLVDNSRSEMLGLLWGSVLFTTRRTLTLVSVTTVLLGLFAAAFNKELKAILFGRSIAEATGIHETLVYSMLLATCGVVISVNLRLIGGLMVFALMVNPAAAAYRICTSYRAVLAVSVFFGCLSGVAGFVFSVLLDVPMGSCVVLASTAIFAAAAICARRTDRRG